MSPNDILAEFQRKYQNSYVFVQMPDSNEDHLFFMSEVRSSKTNIGTMTLESEEFGRIQLNLGTAHSIKFKFPKVGVFQHNKNAMIFTRNPQRQWRRGLCDQNCSIYQTTNHFSNANFNTLDYQLVSSAFKGQTYKYNIAIGMLASGKYRSVALDHGLSLMLSPNKEPGYLLLYWDQIIARVGFKGEVKVILEEVFTPQIREMCVV